MKKADIQKIRIDIVSNQANALTLLLDRDGAIARQGTGKLPADDVSVQGNSDGSAFSSLINMLDERIFPHAAVYDHPHKIGVPITWSIVFLDKDQNTAVFEFRFGSETADVGELLPFFDGFISQAIVLTDSWYTEVKLKTSSADDSFLHSRGNSELS
ncbi:MAG: hypothetical protein B7Y56_01615 [Gallionellales bacterium 35-53-114]|jgi:hypothetical protein|nr:MAG: hypothetical protein B7Y56_01615 [Gallionellales bacterium 35-53-114]OYZ64327.1 MAG: hypothetical protein B7Y04_05395 [Gallionellales bacterium 24-53-125]OZB10365.1 MAG: hypothetical protein B7X61_02310 [Gallionellales bacterium 39-52-133]HQS56972.1 hypothetical protein [Gallionellaceae bacterium]HQS75244.1 hypothetical protein [Gallionellaceae bacterium]